MITTLSEAPKYRARSAIAGLLLTCLGLGAWPVGAEEFRIGHCLYGCPQGADEANHLILRPIYALSYNTTHKSADWVAYTVSAGAIGIASSLSRQALTDKYVAETLSPADFADIETLGMSRATYVPLVSFAGTPYWQDVNFLTNSVARSRSLNQGAWYGLEWSIRNLVNREGEVYVLAGPIFRADATPRRLNTATPHRVPDAFFKIVLDRQGRGTGFILEQDAPVHRHHCDLRADVAEIAALTGLNLFPQNPQLALQPLDSDLGCF